MTRGLSSASPPIEATTRRSDTVTPRLLPTIDLTSILPQWRFIYHSDDNGWTIQNVYNGKYIDIPPVNPGDGTSVIAVDTPTPRRWDVFQDGDGWR